MSQENKASSTVKICRKWFFAACEHCRRNPGQAEFTACPSCHREHFLSIRRFSAEGDTSGKLKRFLSELTVGSGSLEWIRLTTFISLAVSTRGLSSRNLSHQCCISQLKRTLIFGKAAETFTLFYSSAAMRCGSVYFALNSLQLLSCAYSSATDSFLWS